MFARFRQTPHRLQVSIVDTRRVGGRVQHEHVAGLGSIETPPSVADRVAFWRRVHDRLPKLSNRIDAATQGRLMGELHARIPMPTIEEQHALKLENARADARVWAGLQDMHASTADGKEGLVALTERQITENRASAAKAAERLARAKERIARLEQGEDVPGGLGKPSDFEAILRDNGFTDRDIQHCMDMHELIGSDDAALSRFVKDSVDAADRADRARVRKLLRKRRAAEGT
jgi:hypothetical protein